jgi:hypothetical protein
MALGLYGIIVFLTSTKVKMKLAIVYILLKMKLVIVYVLVKAEMFLIHDLVCDDMKPSKYLHHYTVGLSQNPLALI